MLIKITNVQDDQHELDRSNLTFLESESVLGDLEIVFNKGENGPEVFNRNRANIPLFISEMQLFLNQVRKEGQAVWKMYFAPFVDGQLEGKNILVTRGVRGGGVKVVEVITPRDLKEIEQVLSHLAGTYGCLRPSENLS